MPARTSIALDISSTRVRALLARRDGGILRVQKVFTADLPDDLPRDDPNDLGVWIAQALRAAGFPTGGRVRTTIALARKHVGLKRLTLPTIDPHELPDMTRLAMQRQLPFDAETAVIDYVPVAQSESSTTVLAVAVPQEILDYALSVAKAARLNVERVSLRGMGSAMLLRHLGEQASQSILAVDVLNDAIEFCVIDNDTVRFSRAAEVSPTADAEFLADAIITETRRTWMSYRIAEDSSDIRHVVIVGDAEVGSQVAEPIADMLKVDAEVLSHHPLVATSGQEMSRVWPLAGLLLEPAHGGNTIDFAHPRKAPDLAGQRRKRVFFAAAAVLLVLFAGWTMANRQLKTLRAEVAAAQEQQQRLAPEFLRLNRDRVKLEHISHWQSLQPNWLEHLSHLNEMSPGSDQVVLDLWDATADVSRSVLYDRRNRTWAAPVNMTIDVRGEARDRATADALREALVQEALYTTSSTGADSAGGRRLAYGFTYRLRTDESTPPNGEEQQEEPDQP